MSTSLHIQINKHELLYFLYREQTQSSYYYNEDPGSGSSHGQYDRLRGRPPHLSIDQYSDSSFRSEQEPPPGNYGRDYFSSEDLRGPEGLRAPPLAGRYGGGSSNKRPSIGQAYACQNSPTQPHPPEKKQFLKQYDQEHNQDADVKQGLRSWRIHSYLSTYEDNGEEGLAQPMGSDAFEDPPTSQLPNTTETSSPHFGIKEPPKVPPKPRPDILKPRFGRPILSESKSKDSAQTATTDLLSSASDSKPFVLEKKESDVAKETEKERSTREVESKETPDLFLSKHESFRSRLNPLLQRSSRLRSSLIFSSSKAEMHSSSLGLKPATEEEEQLDPVRTSSIVAQILEKRRSLSRDPFDWRKKAEEENKGQLKEKEEKKEEQQQVEKEILLKEEIKVKEEPQKTTTEVQTAPKVGISEDKTPSSLNMNDPASRLQYFKDLADKRKVSKIETESSLKASEPVEKKPDLSDKPALNPVMTPNIPTVSVDSAECQPNKPDISAKLAELTQRASVGSSKPPISSAKPSVSYLKPSETAQHHKEENVSEGLKDIFKSLKPLPSPKIFRRDPLKLKGQNSRRVSSGDEIMTTDATDAEKSELKKSRSQSSSTMPRDDSKEGLQKAMGSNTSINTLGEGKTLDFLKKQTQRLKGILGPKDKDKRSSGEDRGMSTVKEITGDSSKKQNSSAKDTGSTSTDQTSANNKASTGGSGSSRYQAPGSSVLFSSNLRDDTKAILEQISANSQKNRLERDETTGDRESDTVEKALERQNPIKRNKFLRPQGNNLEREGLLKRIESLRKEKKVYSRFEVVYHCKDDFCNLDVKNI